MEMAMLYTKGEVVEYKTGNQRVRAIVRTRHKDGSATVEAGHFLSDQGVPVGAYLGFKYRLDAADLRYSV